MIMRGTDTYKIKQTGSCKDKNLLEGEVAISC